MALLSQLEALIAAGGPQTAYQLARQLQVEPQALEPMLALLISRGRLVERQADWRQPGSSRQIFYALGRGHGFSQQQRLAVKVDSAA